MITKNYIDITKELRSNCSHEQAKRRLSLTVIFEAVYGSYKSSVKEKEIEPISSFIIKSNWNKVADYSNPNLVKNIIPTLDEIDFVNSKYPNFTHEKMKKYVYKTRLICCLYYLDAVYSE